MARSWSFAGQLAPARVGAQVSDASPYRSGGFLAGPSDEPELLGAHECLRPVRDAELRADVADVPLGGADRDRQPAGDVGVGRALGHEAKHVGLAGREWLE